MLKCTKCNKYKGLDEFHKWNCHNRGYRYHCKECRKIEEAGKSLDHYYRNKEQYAENNKRWKNSNKDKWNQYMRDYRKNNPDYRPRYYSSSQRAKYRACLRNQTPHWSDLDKVMDIYKMSNDLSERHGVRFHVDHIMPINNGGLHLWWNLQILPHYLNESKSDNILEENIIFPRVSEISFQDYLKEIKMYAELCLNEGKELSDKKPIR